MDNEFIPYEQALEFKELGFDEECLAFYNSTFQTPNELLYPQYGGEVGNWNVENHLISAPLYQQAFRWFREKYDLHYYIEFKISAEGKRYYDVIIVSDSLEETENDIVFNTYEEGQLYCLKMLIGIKK